jgi:hypothetical protein
VAVDGTPLFDVPSLEFPYILIQRYNLLATIEEIDGQCAGCVDSAASLLDFLLAAKNGD